MKITCDITTSVDGYVAGPDQSLEHPLGRGAEHLHDWIFDPEPIDEPIIAAWHDKGAYVMGRNMFGPGRGEWDLDWRGWWGEDPPYHVPVFVLTHHPREPLPMAGGTTFHFVTDGLPAAVDQASEVSGELDVSIAGGASTVNQALAAGVIDELHVHVSPIMLGAGERLFDGVPPRPLRRLSVVESPRATHLRYAVGAM